MASKCIVKCHLFTCLAFLNLDQISPVSTESNRMRCSHKNTGFIEWSISKSTTTKANKPIRKFYIFHCYEFTARKTNVKFGYKYTWSTLITNVKQTDKVGSEYFLYFGKQDMCGCTVYHILCRISCIFCVNYTSSSNL